MEEGISPSIDGHLLQKQQRQSKRLTKINKAKLKLSLTHKHEQNSSESQSEKINNPSKRQKLEPQNDDKLQEYPSPQKPHNSNIHSSDNQPEALQFSGRKSSRKSNRSKKFTGQYQYFDQDYNNDNNDFSNESDFQEQEEVVISEKYQFPFGNEYLTQHYEQFVKTSEAIDRAKNELQRERGAERERQKEKEEIENCEQQQQNSIKDTLGQEQGVDQQNKEKCSQGQQSDKISEPHRLPPSPVKSPGTYLNCDVRYFNWEHFIKQLGKFQILIIDPPWRIKGAQQNDSQHMFSNCKFSLQYNTMGNSEIARIPLHLISDEGFIFLWILNSQLDSSVEIMQQWGYQLVDEITWVKLRDGKVSLTHGFYFMHSYEVCLVGYKSGGKKQGMKVRGGLGNNAIFAEVRKKSQKPQDLYALIEMMFPKQRKVQIFARNHNLRFGLFSIGNELGESYEKWNLSLNCDNCENPIQFGTPRYKSKHKPNYDICQHCIQKVAVEQSLNDRDNFDNENTANADIDPKAVIDRQFFRISNEVDQDVRHEYIQCNHCKVEPIWGLRFQCMKCGEFDICESTHFSLIGDYGSFDLYLFNRQTDGSTT